MENEAELIVEEIQGKWRIAWWFHDSGLGAILGESPNDGKGPQPTDQEDIEHWIVGKTILESTIPTERDNNGFFWENKTHATKTLKLAKLALKSCTKKLPDWAIIAQAQGWKPPKGWKP